MSDQEVKTEAIEPKVETEVKPEANESDYKTEDVKPDIKQDSEETTVKEESTTGEKTDKKRGRGPANMLKTTGSIDKDDYSKNSKFDPSSLPETDDPKKIRAQVEFYFGDSNLPQDDYMMKLTGGEANEPVPIAKLHEFKRMRRFQPYSAVVAALKDSTFLEVLEGEGEGQELVKRRKAWDPSRQNKAEERSVYVKGFGDEEPSSQFDIEAFFANFGPTKAVRLRRTPEKYFKGSVFVEFEDKETAVKFMELDPKPQWRGHDLKVMWKKDYVSEKADLIREGKIEPHSGRGRGRGSFRGRGRGRGGYSGDSNDWKKRRDHDQKNGFRDDRNRGRGGRGGRGRGRGGNDRNRDRDDRDQNRDGKPSIRSTDNKGEPTDGLPKGEEAKNGDKTEAPAVPQNTGKRAREEDPAAAAAAADDRPAKKVDTKEDA